ncbi:MAG: flagellar motor protein MotB [Elusimicrobiota bacterium]
MSAENNKKSYSEENIEIGETIDPGSAWLIPYGNMMTILMVFFLILYVFSYQADSATYERVVTKIQKEFTTKGEKAEKIARKAQEAEQVEKMAEYFAEKGFDKFAKVEINAERVRVTLSNPVLFSLGEAVLKPEAKLLLKPISELTKILPSKIIIEGHTDNLPIYGGKYKSNWELSADRAISVVRYMVNEEDVAPERFAVAGYGEFRPVAPNDTEDNRGKNRRIEIVLLRS